MGVGKKENMKGERGVGDVFFEKKKTKTQVRKKRKQGKREEKTSSLLKKKRGPGAIGGGEVANRNRPIKKKRKGEEKRENVGGNQKEKVPALGGEQRCGERGGVRGKTPQRYPREGTNDKKQKKT